MVGANRALIVQFQSHTIGKKERKIIDLEISGKLDKMLYGGMSCQTKLIMLFNQIIDFCFSDKEKTVDLNFSK